MKVHFENKVLQGRYVSSSSRTTFLIHSNFQEKFSLDTQRRRRQQQQHCHRSTPQIWPKCFIISFCHPSVPVCHRDRSVDTHTQVERESQKMFLGRLWEEGTSNNQDKIGTLKTLGSNILCSSPEIKTILIFRLNQSSYAQVNDRQVGTATFLCKSGQKYFLSFFFYDL